jgi:6-pyruvoyltetrahydropterin/6-carboxytetrahydropterin synthase
LPFGHFSPPPPRPFPIFEISVEAEFAAAHSLVIGGEREPVHGHNWHVTVTAAGPQLDADGLLCDFHLIERFLRELIAPMHNRNLNDLPAFAALNPSAENVARHIADQLIAGLERKLAPRAAIASVRITEAPGCAATYYPGPLAAAAPQS